MSFRRIPHVCGTYTFDSAPVSPGEINVTLSELRWLKRFRETNISLGVNKTVEDEIEIASSE